MMSCDAVFRRFCLIRVFHLNAGSDPEIETVLSSEFRLICFLICAHALGVRVCGAFDHFELRIYAVVWAFEIKI